MYYYNGWNTLNKEINMATELHVKNKEKKKEERKIKKIM